jgi:phospholipase C
MKKPPLRLELLEHRLVLSGDINKIDHVVIIMQENRSFDHYFGTYPGADGIPPGVQLPDGRGGYQAPYHLTTNWNFGGPHRAGDAVFDVDGGQMDGFLIRARQGDPTQPVIDIMGYHTRDEIPNYWAYADNFVLMDHMFGSNISWSLPSHLALVSGWSAVCSDANDPFS